MVSGIASGKLYRNNLTLACVQIPHLLPSENNRRRAPFSDCFPRGRGGYLNLKIVDANRHVMNITIIPEFSKLLLS